jgi:hypothetical protein
MLCLVLLKFKQFEQSVDGKLDACDIVYDRKRFHLDGSDDFKIRRDDSVLIGQFADFLKDVSLLSISQLINILVDKYCLQKHKISTIGSYLTTLGSILNVDAKIVRLCESVISPLFQMRKASKRAQSLKQEDNKKNCVGSRKAAEDMPMEFFGMMVACFLQLGTIVFLALIKCLKVTE